MKKEFDKQFMINNRGCYSLEELNECSFMKKDIITLDDILNSEISIGDKYWFVCKKLATKEQNQKIAIAVAEIVLPIFEKKYPDNKAPREAIQIIESKTYSQEPSSLFVVLMSKDLTASSVTIGDERELFAAIADLMITSPQIFNLFRDAVIYVENRSEENN